MERTNTCDVLVIGGGFFGTYLACHLARQGRSVILVEARPALLQAASFVNQARVHNGYHYPRSVLTGSRSRENYERFTTEFADCVFGAFTHYYAIARQGSNVTAQQFALFCERIGAACAEEDDRTGRHFTPEMIDAVFRVKECAFDAEKLRQRMERDLREAGVDVRSGMRVTHVSPQGDRRVSAATGDHAPIEAGCVLHCTYAELNDLLFRSGLPLVPLQQEVVEIALVRLPSSLRDASWTIMDGPFCSSLPFPAQQANSLYHVRYSVHGSWLEGGGSALPVFPRDQDLRTRVVHMMRDGARYVPELRKAEHLRSLWTVRSKLPGSAGTDSRPIMFRSCADLPRLFHVLGGKIDNVYDVVPIMEKALEVLR